MKNNVYILYTHLSVSKGFYEPISPKLINFNRNSIISLEFLSIYVGEDGKTRLPPRFKLIDIGEINPRAIEGISNLIDPLDFLLIVAETRSYRLQHSITRIKEQLLNQSSRTHKCIKIIIFLYIK